MPRKVRIPSYRLHRPSGQAVVTLAGHDHYLGPHDSAASRERYARLLAEWLSAGGRPATPRPAGAPDPLTVAELCDRYMTHAEGYYRKHGKPTSQVDRVRLALAPVRRLYGTEHASLFGARSLKAARQAMVSHGYRRRHVNALVGCVVRAWKWAASEELVPAAAWQALRAVDGLRAGRSAAPESPPVRPVDLADLDRTVAELPPVVAAMVRLQQLTGMRPGEVCLLRPADVDRAGEVWYYRPSDHKTAHHGRRRVVALGPRAQAVLTPYLDRPADAWCFSPAESRALWEAGKRASRKTPVQPSQLDRRVRTPRKQPGTRYATGSYRQAITRACDRAGVPRWHPHQLRHLAATEVRRTFGLEAAQVILGHARADVTEIYAEKNLARAAEVARQVG